MALTKDKKQAVVTEVSQLLATSKLTVIAKYEGTTVKALQSLRRDSRPHGTNVKVVKNRLVIQALKANPSFKNINTEVLQGMLLYAFNSEDELAPAQNLQAFMKLNPTLEFVAAITADGQLMDAVDVKALAALPSKEQLQAIFIGTVAAPLSGFLNVLSGNIRGLMNVMNARADSITS